MILLPYMYVQVHTLISRIVCARLLVALISYIVEHNNFRIQEAIHFVN